MIVVIETVPVFRTLLLKRRNGGAVYYQDVEITVVVVVKQGHARDHRFWLILVGRGATVGDKRQTGTVRDLLKNDRAACGTREKACSEQNSR